MKLEFSRKFSKNCEISNFVKLRPVSGSREVPRGRTDGQADRLDEANSRFSQL